MPTRADLIYEASQDIGGLAGTLGAATTTSAVLSGLAEYTNDETLGQGSLLIFPDAVNDSDKQRNVTGFNPTTGLAEWDTPTTGDLGTRYVLQPRPAYTVTEWRQAVSEALRQTSRTYRKVIPIVPNLTYYPLSSLDWLEGAKYVDAAWVSSSPIFIHNEDFALWWNGSQAVPDGWSLSGLGASVQRVSGGLRSAYAVKVTAGQSADAVLSQSAPQPLVQWFTRRRAPSFNAIRASAWIADGQGSVGIYDGSSTTSGTTVTATYPQYEKVSITPDSTMTDFRVDLTVPAGEAATFHFGGIWQETASDNYAIHDQGSQAYPEYLLEPHHVRNIGGLPTVELPWEHTLAPGQLVIYSRRTFPEMSDDSDIVEDQFYRAIKAGAIRWLLSNQKPGQDRTRLDSIMNFYAGVWTNLSMNLIDMPVPKPAYRVDIVGA